MKIVKVKVFASTRYVGSTVKDTLEIEVDDDATPTEIEQEAEAAYNDWMSNNVKSGFSILE